VLIYCLMHCKLLQSVVGAFLALKNLPYPSVCCACMLQIKRIENANLYGHYAMMRTNMNTANGASVENERLLWHGTSSDTVKVICHRGFNRSYCGKNGKVLSVLQEASDVKGVFACK